MFDKKTYFDQLEILYDKLDNFISHSSKDCGACVDCCINISEGFIFFPLQVDYINSKLQEENKDYKPMTWEEGVSVTLCPFINFKDKKCMAHNYRSSQCRSYPRLLIKSDSSLYNKCVFYEDYDRTDFDSTVPYIEEIAKLNDEIAELNVKYMKEHDNERLKRYKEFLAKTLSSPEKLLFDIETYKKTLELIKDPSINYHLAKFYMKAEDYQTALNEIELILKINPSECRARIVRAKIYDKLNRLEEAVEELKEVLKMEPKNSQSNFMLGIFYLIQGKYDDAYRQFQILLEHNPGAKTKYIELENYLKLCEYNIK